MITNCSTSVPIVGFRAHYVNLGGTNATNAVVHYTLLVPDGVNDPPTSLSGTIPIGTVGARMGGNVSHSEPLSCGQRGASVDVYFTWS